MPSTLLALFGACLLFFSALSARAETQVLPNHVPAVTTRLAPLGRLAPARRLNLAIGLPLRNREALTNLLAALYDPANPQYRQFLTPEQFTATFGPAEKDYTAVAAFLEANGLTVTARHPNRLLLDVNGTVAAIEKTLHLRLLTYPHPTEARSFFAPDSDPALALAVPVLHVSGLSDYLRPRPAMLGPAHPRRGPTANVGSGPNGAYLGNDFRAAYLPGVSLTGAGQAVGLLEFDGFYPSDITAYENLANLPNVPLQTVLLDGFDGSAGSGNEEVALDIQMTISMAPGLSSVILYEAGPNGIGNDVLNRMATDNLAKQLSSSWTFPADASTDQIFQQFITQGQAFFEASGDADAYVGPIDTPADNPYLTIVGGTTLTTSGPGGAWVSETVWNWGGGQGTGGGISTIYGLPAWQRGINMSANLGSTSQRNIPDVALSADNIFTIYSNGEQSAVGGTSCAAPLWAALTALANQQAAAISKPPVGFLNPSLYAIGKATTYSACFHDITTGNNTNTSSPTQFFAVTGFDLCTGWGTPTGSNLINALVSPTFAPVIAAAGWTLLAESCLPTNGAVNPGETVTLSFALQNVGLGNTTNLVATLLATNGILPLGPPQSYGLLPANGQAASQSFAFIPSGTCGAAVVAVLLLQDGEANLGAASFSLPLGKLLSSTTFAQNFDGVRPPRLPAGWTTTVTGAASNWVTSAASSDTAHNSAFAAEPPYPGVTDLISPPLPISSSGAQLTFRNQYNFEASPVDSTVGYDGGRLEIQLGSGAFTDILAAGGSFVAGGYTGTIDVTDTDNPFFGQAAWTGSSAGFITTTVNLPPSAAGQNIRLQWRFGTDTGNYYGGTGWYIDTITLIDGSYSCCMSSLGPTLPVLTPAGWALLAQSCLPTNGAVNPGETVTVSFALQNTGQGNTTNLVATLLATNGILPLGPPQSYGALAAGGQVASRSFAFIPTGTCGATATAILQLQDGPTNLGAASFSLPLGQFIPSTTFAQNFDAVTPPGLPAGWSMAATGAVSNWVPSAALSDTAPNSAFAADSPCPGVAELISPPLPIISSGAQLTFRNNYNLEASPADSTVGYDGGLLEIQLGAGAFTDILAAGGSFAAGGYTGAIDVTDTTNPLSGRAAWTGSTAGFITTTVNLPPAAAGQNIVLKWRLGTDTGNFYGGTGWYIDSLAILDGYYSCCVPLVAPTIATPQATGPNFTFSFQTTSGQTYSLQYNDRLTTSNWTTLRSFAGNGSWLSLTNPISAPQRFYRLLSP